MATHTEDYEETSSLIASSKVEGTPVFNTVGDKLGRILNLMINKHSGHVSYAVLSFGGFLGLGEDHFTIPWKKLTYSLEMHGYVVDIDVKKLQSAPHHAADKPPVYDPAYDALVNSYYGLGH